jgi:hypothetical protein
MTSDSDFLYFDLPKAIVLPTLDLRVDTQQLNKSLFTINKERVGRGLRKSYKIVITTYNQ